MPFNRPGQLCALSLDPAFACYRGVLGATDNALLLDEAAFSEADFSVAPVTDRRKTAIDRKIRASQILLTLGARAEASLARIVDYAVSAPQIFGDPTPQGFRVDSRLLHYGDGDFFATHRDTASARDSGRLVSFVYHFFRSPRAFSGGALRLYGEYVGSEPFIDIEPENDLLTVFRPSTPHEVLPLRLCGGGFADGRFALNGWLVAS